MVVTTALGDKLTVEGFAPHTDTRRSGNGEFIEHPGQVMLDFTGFRGAYVGKLSIHDAERLGEAIGKALSMARNEVTV